MIFPRLLIIASSIRMALGVLAGDIGKYADEYWNSVVLSLRGNTPIQDFKTETMLNMHMDGADPDWASVVLAMHMGGGEVDPYWSNVSLLMLMNGTNASTAIGDVTGKTVTVAGNTQISTTQSKFGGSSCYFDGTGDYLTIPDDTGFDFGTSDFTIESWIYPSNVTGTFGIIGKQDNAFAYQGFVVYITTGGVINFSAVSSDNGTGWTVTASSASNTIVINTWSHVAVTRVGTLFVIYVNGNLVATATNALSIVNNTSAIAIGALKTNGSSPYGGYIDNLRITKGIARYTDSFTPPNREFPAGATTIYDVKGHPVTVAGNTAIVDTQSRFGGYSGYFDGSGDYLKIPMATDFNMGSGDFTIELWYYPISAIASDRVFQTRDGDVVPGLYLAHTSATTIQFYYSSSGSAFLGSGINIPITQSKWQHIAIVNSTQSVKAYVEGVQVGSTYAISGTMYYSASDYMVIGGQSSGRTINGHIDDLRITKGVARYTAAFTPPSRAFPHDVAFYDERGLVPTVTGSPTVSTGTLKYGYGSASLNGTTDYLTFDARSDFGFGTGDFTLEAWVKTSAAGTLLDFRNYPSDYGHFYLATGGYLAFDHTYGAIVGTTTITDNNWHHVAFVRYNNILTLFVDGADSGAAIANANIGSSRQARIGAKVDGTNFFAGNIDQLRLTKAARYVGEFTPQKYLFEDANNNVIWRDETGSKTVTSYGNATISGTSYKYGNGSMYFDGTGDYLSSTFETLSTSNFTVEFWCNISSLSDFGRIISTNAYNTSGGFNIIKENTTNKLYFQISDTTTRPYITSNASIVDSTWHHCVCQRNSNTLEMFIDGVKQSGTAADTPHNLTATTLKVGTGFGEDANASSITLTGFIDDLRITKDIARYVSNFTPPARQNANYGVPVLYDPYWDAVVLGLHMDGTDNGTTFTDVKGKTVTVTGNTVTKTATKKFGTASAYFDGTGDSLSLATTTLFDFGDNDFTIEFWMYPTSISAIQVLYLRRASVSAQGIVIELETDGRVWAYVGDTNTSTFNASISTSVLTLNTWSHLALVRNGSTFTIYLNGAAGGSYTGAFTVAGSTTSLIIGAADNGTSNPFLGYLDDLRITKGVARYTANFQPIQYAFPEVRTPVKTHLDPHYDSVVLNMHMNGPSGSAAFVDEKGKKVTANGSVNMSTAQSKFAPTSAYFDENGDWLSFTASSDFAMGTSDFTIECWLYQVARNLSYPRLFNFAYAWNTADSWALLPGHGDFGATKYVLHAYPHNANLSPLLISSSDIKLGQWVHIAVTRSGSTFRMFINGVLEATATWSGSLSSSGTVPFYVGTVEGTSPTTAYLNGYVDDLRITKGVARYTQSFTVPTLPNPDYKTTPAATDPYWKNVVLHMPMNGADGGTTFTENTGKTVTVNGNTSTQVEQYRFGGSSAYFDGTGDYLSLAQSNALTLSGDFTVEVWVYTTEGSSSFANRIMGSYQNDNDWFLGINRTSASYAVQFGSNAQVVSSSATSLPQNMWHHIAVSRSGTSIRIFINGALDSTVTGSTTFNCTKNFYIASTPDRVSDASVDFAGYIDDLRITNGVARYTANFTPPSLPNPTGYDPYAPNVVLHLPMNTDFTDGTGKAVTVNGNTVISTTTKKFGAGSGYFDGSGDYLSVPDSADWALGTGDFTIEMWVRPNSLAVDQEALAQRNTGDVSNFFFTRISATTGKIRAYAKTGASVITDILSNTGVTANAWSHIAVTRAAGAVKIWVNGTNSDTVTTNGTGAYPDVAYPLLVGAGDNAGTYYSGYIDDLRITKGVARYTANFTPTREPFSLT